MTRDSTEKGTLEGLRILDLADEKGVYCTKILADSGADVIKIEPPGGDPTRRIGPFYQDVPDSEQSLYFWYHNTSKRSITLNLDTEQGRELFKRMAERADVIVESFEPGRFKKLGLGYEELSRTNPRLIMASITGFGQKGPWKDYKCPGIVSAAFSGVMSAHGEEDSPPLLPYGQITFFHASLQAINGIMVALLFRDKTGEGQYIDVPVHSCAVVSLQQRIPLFIVRGLNLKRTGSRHPAKGPGKIGELYACKDGLVCMQENRPPPLEWMEEEGKVEDLKTDTRLWVDRAYRLEKEQHIADVFGEWLKTHTRDEIALGAQKYGRTYTPVRDTREAFEGPPLHGRNFFVKVEHPELGICPEYPGAPYSFSEAPWRISRRAPLIGEHNLDIYGRELGLNKEQLVALKSAGVI